MEKNFEKKYHEIEESHFWFKSRRKYIRDLLLKSPRNARILDIGCSSGILLNELRDDGFKTENLFGVDISEAAIENCKKNDLPNTFVMNGEHIKLEEKFDIIIASDCLEHIENDSLALENWFSLLNPNGHIYVFVPAFMSLWSNHDKVNMHFRRYTLNELTMKLKKANFHIQKNSYWNFMLFLPVYLMRKVKKLSTSKNNDSGDLDKIPLANTLLYHLINTENKLLSFVNFPIGISAFCIATKK